MLDIINLNHDARSISLSWFFIIVFLFCFHFHLRLVLVLLFTYSCSIDSFCFNIVYCSRRSDFWWRFNVCREHLTKQIYCLVRVERFRLFRVFHWAYHVSWNIKLTIVDLTLQLSTNYVKSSKCKIRLEAEYMCNDWANFLCRLFINSCSFKFTRSCVEFEKEWFDESNSWACLDSSYRSRLQSNQCIH